MLLSNHDFLDQQLDAPFLLQHSNIDLQHVHEAPMFHHEQARLHFQASIVLEVYLLRCPLHSLLYRGRQSVEYPPHRTRQALAPISCYPHSTSQSSLYSCTAAQFCRHQELIPDKPHTNLHKTQRQ
uniref:Uncharacterized protein n=1 Tax=Medicago truncatula TaxID=3880 RepID=I3SBY8_MEDTR|nr:unknown [Medicago truncatula]